MEKKRKKRKKKAKRHLGKSARPDIPVKDHCAHRGASASKLPSLRSTRAHAS